MKANRFKSILLAFIILPAALFSQTKKEKEIIADGQKVKAEFIKTDATMASLFKNAFGYAIFPNVGKGAIGVGGAFGNGAVYQGGKYIGASKLSQATVGVQLGGQAYGEVIFFEDKAALDHFKGDNYEFSGQVSAVAAKEGASTNIKYREGVLVFTEKKGGAMFEASVGGQKFSYTPVK